MVGSMEAGEEDEREEIDLGMSGRYREMKQERNEWLVRGGKNAKEEW